MIYFPRHCSRGQQTPTNVFGFGCDGPAQLHDKLLGVQADLDDVIQESEERSQREGGHEKSHHSELDDYRNGGRKK